MGTMLQGYDLTLADFDQLEGCNEILNRTRPDIVRAIHDAYFEVGVDAVETNTFGTNLAALGEYGISDQIFEPGRGRGPDRPGVRRRVQHGRPAPAGCWAASGPAPSCPTLGHVGFSALRDAYQRRSRACWPAASTRC